MRMKRMKSLRKLVTMVMCAALLFAAATVNAGSASAAGAASNPDGNYTLTLPGSPHAQQAIINPVVVSGDELTVNYKTFDRKIDLGLGELTYRGYVTGVTLTYVNADGDTVTVPITSEAYTGVGTTSSYSGYTKFNVAGVDITDTDFTIEFDVVLYLYAFGRTWPPALPHPAISVTSATFSGPLAP